MSDPVVPALPRSNDQSIVDLLAMIEEMSEDIDGGAPDTVYGTDDIVDGGSP